MAAVEAIRAALAAVAATEWVAVALALAYLVLAVRQNPWCWAFAIASAGLYFVLFARGGLAMQSALQVFYIGMAVYGWVAWRGGARDPGLAVSRWPAARHLPWLLGVLAVAVLNGRWVAGADGGAVPYVDALVAWSSVLATWLTARKVLDSWLYWIGIDLVAAALYWSQGFHATSVLFLVYVVIAARGWVAWRADLARPPAAAHA